MQNIATLWNTVCGITFGHNFEKWFNQKWKTWHLYRNLALVCEQFPPKSGRLSDNMVIMCTEKFAWALPSFIRKPYLLLLHFNHALIDLTMEYSIFHHSHLTPLHKFKLVRFPVWRVHCRSWNQTASRLILILY